MFQNMASAARRATGINTLFRDILAGETLYRRSSQSDDAAEVLDRMARQGRPATLPTLGPKPEGENQDRKNTERNQCNQCNLCQPPTFQKRPRGLRK